VIARLDAGGLAADIGPQNIYKGNEWIGATVRRAYDDATSEIQARD
jgi:SulP family sulfate permease